jgi:pyrimidine operon attenuation protein/uracil phosphoribosyltransferase
MKKTSTLILNNDDVEKKLARIAFQIIEEYYSEKELLIVGVSKNGFLLAEKIIPLLTNDSFKAKTELIELKIDKKKPSKKNHFFKFKSIISK